MKVILLKDIPKVGQRNTVKEVKDGFALNMLIPRGLARQATPEAIRNVQKIKEKREADFQARTKVLKKKLEGGGEVAVKAKANEKGHLFAGISQAEIAEKIGVPESLIVFYSPIKEVGQHEVLVEVGEKSHKVKVVVSAE